MSWQVAASWGGVLVSIIFGVLANHRSKATMHKAAEATNRSREALAANQSMAQSLDKIAESFSRHGRPTGTHELEYRGAARARRAAAEARPEWNIEYRNGSTYALRNVGTGHATDVTIDAGPVIARDLPAGTGVSLEPGQAHTFTLIGTWQVPPPTDLVVKSQELPVQHVAVPPKVV
jgi:hypothetical protein